MIKKTIVAIDSDVVFLKRLNQILDDLSLLSEYDYRSIEPRVSTADEVVNYCNNKVNELLKDSCMIELVLVDIVIVEREEPPQDRSGLDIAKQFRYVLPQVPIVGMTRFIRDYRLISEISMDPYLHGIILKPFMESKEFSRIDFLNIIFKAREKVKIKIQEHYPPPIERPKGAEGRFQLQKDPRCHYQVLQIGKDDFMIILERLFPSGQGTVTYLRPGFSGSYLFKVSVKTVVQGESPSSTQNWLVKISDDEEKLKDELQRCVNLKNRIPKNLYPQLLKEDLTVFNKWAAIAFELLEDAVTFSEYLHQHHYIKELTKLINNSLIPFLREHYGDPKNEHCFIWRKFYILDEKTKAGILTFIDEVQTIQKGFSRLEKSLSR